MRLKTQKKVSFDIHKEMKVFLDLQPKYFDTNKASTSRKVREMSKRFDQIIRKQPMRKVSKLQKNFKSCLTLIHDKDDVAELIALM